MAGGPDAGHGSDRPAGPPARLRLAAALLLLARRLPRRVAPHQPRGRRALRPAPRRGRLADRQRIRLPRHRAEPVRVGAAGVPALAGRALHDDRRAEHRLGHGVLEPGLPQLRRDRPARADRDRGAPGAPARLAAVLVGRGGGVQPRAGGDPARAVAGAAGVAQLHGLLHRVQPPRRGGGPRHRHLGHLPARRHADALPQRRGKGALGTDRAPGHPVVPPRPVPRHVPGRPLVGDGAAAWPGELGPLEPGAARRHGAAVDLAGVCARRRGGELLPLAAGTVCAGADAHRPAAPRFLRRPGRARSRAGRRGAGGADRAGRAHGRAALVGAGRRGAGVRLRRAVDGADPAAGRRLQPAGAELPRLQRAAAARAGRGHRRAAGGDGPVRLPADRAAGGAACRRGPADCADHGGGPWRADRARAAGGQQVGEPVVPACGRAVVGAAAGATRRAGRGAGDTGRVTAAGRGRAGGAGRRRSHRHGHPLARRPRAAWR